MQKLTLVLIAAGLFAAIAPSPAEAAFCRAQSRTGSWGVGRGYTTAQARALALTYCAVNTPRGYTCYIVRCRR